METFLSFMLEPYFPFPGFFGFLFHIVFTLAVTGLNLTIYGAINAMIKPHHVGFWSKTLTLLNQLWGLLSLAYLAYNTLLLLQYIF